MTDPLVRQTRFTTFDGTLSLSTSHQRPDRFHHLESQGDTAYRIPRGGGYAYAAASFGEDSLVVEMTKFDRFLEFDPSQRTLRLEAGVRLIDLMEWALPRQLYIPVLPGYPLITVGGCVAADVHGKNPFKDGTFSDWVQEITLFHPQYGYQSCSRLENPELFALTCGGYGLTGIITDVTLQLAELPASSFSVSKKSVTSLEEALSEIATSTAAVVYSWHDGCPGSRFGRGFVCTAEWAKQDTQYKPMKFRPVTADSRSILPFSAWNGLTAQWANTALWLQGRYQKANSVTSVLDASFPFASNVHFHRLFGKPGLRESQFLVSEDKASQCVQALDKLICEMGAPTMMLSLKRFKGVQKSLSMSGSGFLIAIDCFRNSKTELFMQQLDQLMVDFGGQPNLSKDSRLSGEVAQVSIAHYEEFKSGLLQYDKDRTMRSELSKRVGLL